MSWLQITLINAYTDYPTTNRAGNTNSSTLSVPIPIYSSLTPPFGESGPTTSTQCCTFELQEYLTIQVEGICAALSGLSNYVLKGVLDGITVLETDRLPVPDTQPTFVVTEQTLTWVGGIPPFPCRLGGGFMWQIFPAGANSKSHSPVLSPLPFAKTPCHSSCGVHILWYTSRDVFRMGPPAGPNNLATADVLARPNFQGTFPIDLVWLFLPALSEFTNDPPNYPWYLNRVSLGRTMRTATQTVVMKQGS